QDQSLVLILDDYHRLNDATQINRLLQQLMEHLPPAIHLVVTSRQPVTFSIARLRGQGQLLEISEDALRFTSEAARQLFLPGTPSAALLALIQQAEGWITGLQLIRQVYLQAQPGEFDQIMIHAPDWLRGIFDFLAEEVFERLPVPLQAFLVQSSILDTLVPADCDAIFERADSTEWLSYLVTHGLYTVLLARNPDTYRYHHLLRDFLRQRSQRYTDTAQVSAWHTRAAEHYRDAQRWSEAFQHAIQVDEKLAAETFLSASALMRLNGQNNTLQHWLDQFSEKAYMLYPYLYAWLGIIWEDQGQHEKALGAFHLAISCGEAVNERRSLYGGWLGLGIVYQKLGKLDQSLEAWKKAVDYAEHGGSVPEQTSALNGLAVIHLYMGQNPQALEIFHRCLALTSNLVKPMQALIVHNIGTILTYMGEYSEAMQWCEEAYKLKEESNVKPGMALSLSNIGRLHTLLGNLEQAEIILQRTSEIYRETSNPLGNSYALSNLGELAEARGAWEQAEALYRQSIAIKEQQHDTLGLQHTWALLSELRRRQGDYPGAEECARQTLQEGLGATSVNENLLLQGALALAWLSGGQTTLALEELKRLSDLHRSLTNNHYELARCLWYQAQAQFQLGQDGRPALQEALALAERWEYHFLISRLAKELPHLVGVAVAEELQPVFVGKVLGRLGDAAVPILSKLLNDPDPVIRQRAIQRLAELGTDGTWHPVWQAAEQDADGEVIAQAKTALARLGATTPPPLRVTTLGRFTLRVGEREVNPTEWGNNRKAQSLFKILLSQAGKHVSREKIIDQLWPGTSFQTMENANHTLNQAMSALRKVLEPYLPAHYPSRYIFSDNETYCLTLPPGSWTDDQALEEAIRLAKAARRQGKQEEMIRQYQAASGLYEGDYLVEESKLDWPLARQDWLREQIVGVLEALARLGLEQNDPQGATELAERLLGIDALHEAGYLLLMRAQVALGQLKAALNTYQRYVENCCQVLDISPNAEIREGYEGVLREMRKR
ncbi:MAG: tetratricopeptide repeat protein, partial [Anaerolineales bacterium]|nr:tetratricopeptide repeat protein [Anaerolineales bacterium]